MNRIFHRWIGTTFGIGLAALRVAAQLANDGASSDTLLKLANQVGANEAEAALSVVAGTNPALLAEQVNEGFPFFAVRQVWYTTTFTPTNGVYSVSSDFTPAAAGGENRGGVAGWIDTAAARAIAFYVRPAGGSASFRLATLDFTADNGADNESTAHLFNPDGSPATFETSSAAADLGSYDSTKPATFTLSFSAPSAADKSAVAGATARVTAVVKQAGASGTSGSISRTVELLTDLPVPAVTAHRFGYFAYWGSLSGAGPIGTLDNLTVSGGVAPVVNALPAINLVQPKAGSLGIGPVDLTLEATASDSDGSIRRVDFLSGDDIIASVSSAPFTTVWPAVPAGTYAIRARAVDNLGGTTTTSRVSVVIQSEASGGEPPLITAAMNGNSLTLSWPLTAAGFRLQSVASLNDSTWVDVPSSNNSASVSAASGSRFFRLIKP